MMMLSVMVESVTPAKEISSCISTVPALETLVLGAAPITVFPSSVRWVAGSPLKASQPGELHVTYRTTVPR